MFDAAGAGSGRIEAGAAYRGYPRVYQAESGRTGGEKTIDSLGLVGFGIGCSPTVGKQ